MGSLPKFLEIMSHVSVRQSIAAKLQYLINYRLPKVIVIIIIVVVEAFFLVLHAGGNNV